MSSINFTDIKLSEGRRNICWFLKNIIGDISSPFDVSSLLNAFLEITTSSCGAYISGKLHETVVRIETIDNSNEFITIDSFLSDKYNHEKLMDYKDVSGASMRFATEIKAVMSGILERISVIPGNDSICSLMGEALDIPEHEVLFMSRLNIIKKQYMHRVSESLETLLKRAKGGGSEENTLAAFLGFTLEDMRKIRNGKLCELGLLVFRDDAKNFFGIDNKKDAEKAFVFVNPLLDSVIEKEPANAEIFASMLSGRRMEADSELSWDDFSHLGKLRDIAAALLRSKAGGSVLLVGPPGLGKTQFAAVLSREAGTPLFSVGESHEGNEPNRKQRFAALKTAVAVNKTQSVLLLDEAEDVLEAPGDSTDRFEFSKAHLNRFLDDLKVPVIWTTNTTRNIDPATLRRMGLVIAFETPNAEVRTRIWERTLRRHGIKDADSVALAREWSAPAGLCATVARTVQLAAVESSAINTVMEGFSRVMHIQASGNTGTFEFDPELCEAETDIAVMTENLRNADSLSWNMCLYGPPGTGKSAYARYVAQALGMEVLFKKASDLMDMFVGGTEKNIAEAFRTAKRENKILIIDEADSMLASREAAVRSWEISQVNEMLTQMESHPLPFFATTNLMDRIDTAALRRFVFKMKFSNLSTERAVTAFHRILGIKLPEGLLLPVGLSSGDIAPMRKRMKILKVSDPHTIVKWLHEEAILKGERRNPIGF